MQKVIISVLGIDRPGILAALSRELMMQECNIENVSQTILQSVFGAILIVSKPTDLSEEALAAALRKGVSHLSLDVFVKRYDSGQTAPAFPDSDPFVITTMGLDRKGLVAGITAVLSSYGANVTNMQAVFKGGDDPLNNMMIYEVDVPKSVELPSLHAALRTTASELGLDVNIQHRRIFEAINRI